MESDGRKLKEYVLRNSKFWTWPPDEDHEVTFLGFEETQFKFKSGDTVPTIRYHFRLANGVEKSRDVRSLTFADMMACFKSGDRLKIRRNKLTSGKYEYAVSKIE